MKKTFYLIILSIFVFMSCSQDDAINTSEIDAANLSSSNMNVETMARAVISYYKNDITIASKGANSEGSNFIEPFFLNEGLFVATGEFPIITFVGFSADYTIKGDFYRENPDGTISVHLNSNKAYASVFTVDFTDFSYSGRMQGYPAHLSLNYTGNLYEEDVYDWETGEFLYTYKIVDWYGSSRGNSMHGNGKVTDIETGEEHKITLTWERKPNDNGYTFNFNLD